MEPKVIKSEADYRSYLQEVARLAALDPAPESRDGEKLELLALLVESYEKQHFPFSSPDPVEAIKFRMHEQGLRQTDLVPYFGTRSRVSEVLNRKRPLTVQMIRELSDGLEIPASVLLASAALDSNMESVEGEEERLWEKLPAREMERQGYFTGLLTSADRSLKELAHEFYTRVITGAVDAPLLAKRTLRGDAVNAKAQYALLAWKAQVLYVARRQRKKTTRVRFTPNALSSDFLRSLVALSTQSDGVQRACSLLGEIGIPVVVEPRLPGTQLDGASILDSDGTPVIGLTLRFDRIDSFWFTLVHEIAHVTRHLSSPGDSFLDRLDDCDATDELEIEANRVARDALISRAAWRRSELAGAPSRERILRLANDLLIHPAIVAGRVRRETGNYRLFGDLLGQGEVRRHFPGIIFG